MGKVAIKTSLHHLPPPMAEPKETKAETASFSTDHLKGDLKQRSVRGTAVTMLAQGGKFGLQVASTAILARLITPTDFGLVAAVTAITSFVVMLRDFGLSAATIQRPTLTQGQVSMLFWVNVAGGVLLAGLTAAISGVIAWFYNDARLMHITLALALVFIPNGLAVQHLALLKREMRFVSLAIIQVGALGAGVGAALITAWRGGGYWALVVMQLVMALVTMLGAWICSSWRPGWPEFGAKNRELLSFGGHLTSFNILNYVARHADNILIGRFIGATALGLYSRAYALLVMPTTQLITPLSQVAVTTLCRLHDNPKDFRGYYLAMLRFAGYLTMPLIAIVATLADEIVLIVLGDSWLPVATLFRLLAVAAFWQPASSTVGWLYVATNQTRRMAKWALMTAPIIVLSFVIGISGGAQGVALSYSVCMTALVYFIFAYAIKGTPITMKGIVSALQRPVLLSLVLVGGLLFLKWVLPPQNTGWLLIEAVIFAILMGMGLLRFWPAFGQDMAQMKHTVEELWRRKKRDNGATAVATGQEKQ